MKSFLLSHQDAHRHTRGIGAIVSAFAGGMMFISILKDLIRTPTATIRADAKFHRAIQHDLASTDVLVRRFASLATKTYYWEDAQRLASEMDLAALRLRTTTFRLQDVINDMLHNRLTPRMIDPSDLNAAFSQVQIAAQAHHLHVSIPTAADLYYLPCSTSMHEGRLLVNIFVPLATEKLPMYQFLGTPLGLNTSSPVRPLRVPRPLHDVIAAAGRSSNYVSSSLAVLEKSCLHIKGHYLCPDLITRLDREEDCLAGLFSANARTISARCRIEELTSSWHISRAGDARWAVTTNTSLAGTTSCPNGTSFARHLPVGQSIIALSPGCHFQTPHFKLHSSGGAISTIHLASAVSYHAMPRNISLAPRSHFSDISHAADALLHTVSSRPIPAATASSPSVSPWVIATTVCTLIIGASCLLFFGCYLRRSVYSLIQPLTQSSPAAPNPVVSFSSTAPSSLTLPSSGPEPTAPSNSASAKLWPAVSS